MLRSLLLAAAVAAVGAGVAAGAEPAAKAPAAPAGSKVDFTINPDGTGKVTFEVVWPPLAPPAGANLAAEETAAKQIARQMTDVTPGVEVWADVGLVKMEDNRYRIKGTAYFKDVSKMGAGPGQEGAASWVKDPQGGMTLTVVMHGAAPEAKPPEKPRFTDEQVASLIKTVREQFKRDHDKIAAAYAGMQADLAYHLPGTAAESGGFVKVADGSLHYYVDGTKLMAALEKAMADDDVMRQCFQAGKSPAQAVISKELAATLKAHMTGDLKPLFDFEAEVKAAKEALPKMLEKLGPPPAPPAVTPPTAAPPAEPVPAPKKL
jgi:hypothetical protein